jgi:tetratricopeptide (TPR) repeat protein
VARSFRIVCRRAILCLVAVAAYACAAKAPPAPAAPAAPTPAQRLTSADALLREGCLDCLIDAFNEYDRLRQYPAVADAASTGAVRAAALVARRQRELGMIDDGYGQRARSLTQSATAVPGWMTTALDVVDALPASGGGMTRTPTSDIDLDRQRVLRVNQDKWISELRDLAKRDELGAYLWLALACTATELRDQSLDQLLAPVEPFAKTPLIAMKSATCRAIRTERLGELAAANPRFIEVEYWVGLFAVGQRKLNDADAHFEAAYGWRQQWPSLTQSIANVAMTSEEFERALTFYDRTLELEPKAVDALLGRVRALTFLGKAEDAIATADRLIAIGWYVGDARYWRAFNENELERYDEAWSDVEAANRLQINADVPKLAGLIAYRRQQLEVSRDKFQLAHTRNQNDCETFFYLGIVNAELRAWQPTTEILPNAVLCLQVNEENYRKEMASIESSDDPPARKTAKIARREQYIAKGRRQIATSYFDTAVAAYNLSRKSEAQQYAQKVIDDEQFGARAKEILSRLR